MAVPPENMQRAKANHHTPPPTLSVHALDFQYVPDFPVQMWLFGLTMDCTILLKFNFPKMEVTAVLVFPEITQNLDLRQVEFGIA